MMMDEFGRKANAYVEESFKGIDRELLDAHGLTEIPDELSFRQNSSLLFLRILLSARMKEHGRCLKH